MLYKKQTSKSIDQAFGDVQASVKGHGFGMLHYYDLRKILADKGFELPNECLVLEVCNPRQAAEVLGMDMTLNMALPCRISIYEDHGKTYIGMVPPTVQLALISDDERIAEAAREVERTLQQIIDSAA
ncbi:MAG: DUF302 domain-containing protein [Rhodanobacter sp.]|jgi:uncharacterized protein (DUF302 family)|nr:DUF302 domain-containing protein [Rhodanobacter sp.]